MSKYSQHLTYSLLASLAGLPVGCIAGGLLIGFYGLFAESANLGQFPDAFFFGFFVAMVAAFIGILPSFLYGAPLYALLSRHKKANTLTALATGALPGLLVLPSGPDLAVFFLLFGTCVALATHLFARRRLARLDSTGGRLP